MAKGEGILEQRAAVNPPHGPLSTPTIQGCCAHMLHGLTALQKACCMGGHQAPWGWDAGAPQGLPCPKDIILHYNKLLTYKYMFRKGKRSYLGLQLQVMQAACGPAESNGGNRLVDLSPSLPVTVVIRFYRTEPCTEPFRRSKSLNTPWRHSPE
eukprot:1156072-Pelagomonas_calceolata.AAC.3